VELAGRLQDVDASIYFCPQCVCGGNVCAKEVGVFMD